MKLARRVLCDAQENQIQPMAKILRVWMSTQADCGDAKHVATIDTTKPGAYEAARAEFVRLRDDPSVICVWVDEVKPDVPPKILWRYP